MPQRSALVFPLFLAAAFAVSCGGGEDSAAPVATPSVTLPQQEAAIGSPMAMTYRFDVAPDAPRFSEDYWVFVHFLDSDGELMWTDDHAPPTPTSAWTAGDTIQYERTMFIPKFPYVGRTRVEVGLFSPATGERLPLAGETEGQRAYVVAAFDLRLQTDNVIVTFGDGWYETEAADGGAGIEWQWSRQEGTLRFSNPRRDITFYLQLDQPVSGALPQPQRVDVRLGSTVVDSFPLPSGTSELRRIPLSAAQLGEAETVELTVTVDQTFVPAELPRLQSTDSRVLGVRVFRAYVQPS